LLKKTEKLEKKCITRVNFFFFVRFLFRENHTEEENFVIREISLQTNKQTTTQARGQKREENKTENHGTRGLLSLFFFAFGAFLFEGVVVWWKKEEEEQKKHQSSVDKDFSGFIIRTFKQH
jgi:hypothetical protein